MKKKSGTLLILSPGFPANEADSTCLPAQQSFIKCINRQLPFLKIIILAFQYPYTDNKYSWHGNSVIPFNGHHKGKGYRLLLWMRVWKTLRKLQKQHTITGVLSFWLGECALVGSYFSKKNHHNHFTWLLGQDARKENAYAKWIPLQPASLLAISDSLADTFYKAHGIKPQHIITNGIDPGLYAENDPVKDIDIIGVGSLIPLKRYDLFIEMIHSIAKQLPGITVLICGNGPEKDALQALINKYGLQTTISLTGERSHNEVLHLMQRSKVLLHTSSYEGFSGVCLEALYAGAHVVSFHNPMKEWIRHWHIATDKDDMIMLLLEILRSQDTVYRPVLPHTMMDSAGKVMELFGL